MLGLICYFHSGQNPRNYNLPYGYTFAENPWGNSFYKIYRASMTYLAAKAKCESDGATLATPRSDAENDFFVELLPGENIWIGINDIDQEGRFVYDDGSDVSYTKWNTASGEPSGSDPFRPPEDSGQGPTDITNWSLEKQELMSD